MGNQTFYNGLNMTAIETLTYFVYMTGFGLGTGLFISVLIHWTDPGK